MEPWRPANAGKTASWQPATSYSWHQFTAFLGFTGASSGDLLTGQRNLLANDQQLVRQSIALCDKAISARRNDPAQLEKEVLFHSNAKTSP